MSTTDKENKIVQRYFELSVRRASLKEMLKKAEDEMSNNFLTLIGGDINTDLKKINSGTVVMLKNWHSEVEAEMEDLYGGLSSNLFVDMCKAVVKDAEEKGEQL